MTNKVYEQIVSIFSWKHKNSQSSIKMEAFLLPKYDVILGHIQKDFFIKRVGRHSSLTLKSPPQRPICRKFNFIVLSFQVDNPNLWTYDSFQSHVALGGGPLTKEQYREWLLYRAIFSCSASQIVFSYSSSSSSSRSLVLVIPVIRQGVNIL